MLTLGHLLTGLYGPLERNLYVVASARALYENKELFILLDEKEKTDKDGSDLMMKMLVSGD